jgi:hypothetical protein
VALCSWHGLGFVLEPVDSLDTKLAQTAIEIRPETFCYLLRVIARHACAFWRSRHVELGVLRARPPIAAGVWYKHFNGRLPVLGVRFGGLKTARFGLPIAASQSGSSLDPEPGSWLLGPKPCPEKEERKKQKSGGAINKDHSQCGRRNYRNARDV